MNYRQQLQNPASIGFIDDIVNEALLSPNGFDELFELAFDQDKAVAWRAGWACDKICRKHPEMIAHEGQLLRIVVAVTSETHKSVVRSYLSILNSYELPAHLPVSFINVCFERMISPKADVSHQVLSMKLLYKVCLTEPAFLPEFVAYLENASAEEYTPGFNSTRSKILKQLSVSAIHS